ncbi:hypothetical protein PsYK624_045040 [Phanerochaete sordida]|uniref:Uncharacterized protein n=1 Tax=Phanerochaete sordida TaxID=48140 RepID=A0A9P3LAH8_9APHY|nr:hypothetical protein PsYK624_045040 [Phanerochaete sordida]
MMLPPMTSACFRSSWGTQRADCTATGSSAAMSPANTTADHLAKTLPSLKRGSVAPCACLTTRGKQAKTSPSRTGQWTGGTAKARLDGVA